MTLHPEERAVDQEMVTGVIASGLRALRFPAVLEAYFEAETGRQRSHQLLLGGLAGIAFSLLYLVIDWKLTPDVFEMALWARVGIITPLSLLIIAVLWRNPPPWLRESLVGAMCVVVVFTTLFLMLKSETPLRDGHHVSSVLVVLFLIMMRVRFPYAVASCAAIFGLYAWALIAQVGYAPERMFTNIATLGCASVLVMIASYSLEHEVRLSYLHGLRERLRSIDLKSQSLHDALTGLDNRRSLEETLARLVPHGGETRLAVLLIDIDHFKSYNDSLGHLAGDVCLKRVAALIKAELRVEADIAFRFGGEEFLVVLPDADLPTAVAVAERIRHGVEAAAIPHPGEQVSGVLHVSVGVAAALLGGTVTVQELISGADSALYAAKRAGRNQVWPRTRPVGVVANLSANRDARARQ